MNELMGMGRLPQPDGRNMNFLLPRVEVPREVRHRFWNSGGVLDQGDSSMCVGFAGWGWLAGGPVVNRPAFTPADLYQWARASDEWPGEDYEGTSTLGLMKALKEKGYIDEYLWATDAETLVAWVLTTGPVLVGTNWYMDFFTPTVTRRGEFLFPNKSELAGGHEWRIVGADRDKACPDGTRGAVRMVNSWGTGWGEQGRAWMTLPVLQRLLDEEEGEAVTCREIKLP